MKFMNKAGRVEKVLWSIALPGFGQILNGHLIKGLVFIGLEFLINIQSNLNRAIILSFQGSTVSAVSAADYDWLMFYPCIYMFAVWDAYKNAEEKTSPYSFMPFIIPAYLGTIGVIYSSTFSIRGVVLGPVLLPIICLILGACLGYVLKLLTVKHHGR